MKTIKSLLFTIIALLSAQTISAQCTGSLSVTGTDPTFTITSTNGTGTFTNYYWDLGDGNSSSTPQSVTHTYATNGVYWVTCYFSDSVNMCSDVDTIQVTVTNAVGQCNASFSIAGNSPTFTFTPNNTPSSPLGYYYFDWSFGDGTTAGSSNMNGVSHTYTANGVYTVTCILYDSIFCTDTVSATIAVTNINPSVCDASFTFSDSNGFYYFFPTNPVSGNSYDWYVSDGQTSTLQNPVFQLTAPGVYTVELLVTNSINSCSDSSIVTITINGNPATCNATFTYTVNSGLYTFYPSYPMNGATYSWITSNGLSSNLQSPTFNLSTSGSYTVCMAITDSALTCLDSFCLSITVAPPVNNTIYGAVTMGNSPADDGVVFLIELDSVNGTLTAIDTTMIDSMGYYTFSSVLPGIYLVKAALSPASVNYSGYLPTYYATSSGGELLWNNASYATSPNSMVYYDISLVAGTNTGGPGFVGGLVSQGANKVGDPISDIMVMVTDINGNPVGYGYSDNTGAFFIDDLAYGDYILYPEVFGKTTTPAPFTLSSAVNDINYFRITVNSTSVEVSMATGVEEASILPEARIYPNPVHNELNIDFGRQIQEPVQVSIYDLLGRSVYSSVSTSSSLLQLDTEFLSEGMYLLELRSSNERQVFRFSK